MQYTIGVDEVGMGSYAGTLCVCAIKAPTNWTLSGLNDSKQLTRIQRSNIAKQLLDLANRQIIEFKLELFNNDEIDKLSLGVCHKIAIANSINSLYKGYESIIIDGNVKPTHFAKNGLKADLSQVTSIIKADTKYPTVMAASVLAKHYRDTLMIECHNSFPYYEWNKNVGYITAAHLQGIRQHGLSCLHRKSYNVKI